MENKRTELQESWEWIETRFCISSSNIACFI